MSCDSIIKQNHKFMHLITMQMASNKSQTIMFIRNHEIYNINKHSKTFKIRYNENVKLDCPKNLNALKIITKSNNNKSNKKEALQIKSHYIHNEKNIHIYKKLS